MEKKTDRKPQCLGLLSLLTASLLPPNQVTNIGYFRNTAKKIRRHFPSEGAEY